MDLRDYISTLIISIRFDKSEQGKAFILTEGEILCIYDFNQRELYISQKYLLDKFEIHVIYKEIVGIIGYHVDIFPYMDFYSYEDVFNLSEEILNDIFLSRISLAINRISMEKDGIGLYYKDTLAMLISPKFNYLNILSNLTSYFPRHHIDTEYGFGEFNIMFSSQI
jgi:hypothetical protein